MSKLESLVKTIEDDAFSGSHRTLTGRDALTRNLYLYLLNRYRIDADLLILATSKGVILDMQSAYTTLPMEGYGFDTSIIKSYLDIIDTHRNSDDYTLYYSRSNQADSQVRPVMTNLKVLLSTIDNSLGQDRFLLDCLDAIDNAICIYDSEGTLMYGNTSYFVNMHIHDPEMAIGKNIMDITRDAGIRIEATHTGSANLKMLDVLKSGHKTLDWEVKIESETAPNKAQFVSNNMYPIKNKSGQVIGLIEIAHTHQLNLNSTRQMLGLTAEYTFDSIIGSSPAINEARQQAMNYAESPYNLLIIGESGTGKELFAQSVHNESSRRKEPFVAVNCASFPENLIESELFGYVGGAFTGASKTGQMGKFELADGGTLFLDEIEELPPHFQSKFLRVLETRKITRIGATKETPVNVRVIAATNRDLGEMIEEGLFRKDLYYRLQVLSITVPPLRERTGDVLDLTEFFLNQAAELTGNSAKKLSSAAKDVLSSYNWPGNVRELRNVIQRASLLEKGDTITSETIEAAIFAKSNKLGSSSDNANGTLGTSSISTTNSGLVTTEASGADSYSVPEPDNLSSSKIASGSTDSSLSGSNPPDPSPTSSDLTGSNLTDEELLASKYDAINDAYRELLETVFKITNGNKKRAADLMGVSRTTLYRMMEKYQ